MDLVSKVKCCMSSNTSNYFFYELVFTSEMRAVAAEKGRRETSYIRMKFDVPETDFQLVGKWVKRHFHSIQ